MIQVLAASNGKWSKNSDERTAALAEAWELRNESLANRDFDSALTRRYQAILICVALAILIIAVFGSAFVNPELSEGVEEWWVALASALAGALGGSASALQRTTRRGTTSTAIKVGYLLSALSRPVIGAIGGITVFLAVRAGATQTSEEQVAYVLLVSFGAGFFERLVVRDPRRNSPSSQRLRRQWPPLFCPVTTMRMEMAMEAMMEAMEATGVPATQWPTRRWARPRRRKGVDRPNPWNPMDRHCRHRQRRLRSLTKAAPLSTL